MTRTRSSFWFTLPVYVKEESLMKVWSCFLLLSVFMLLLGLHVGGQFVDRNPWDGSLNILRLYISNTAINR